MNTAVMFSSKTDLWETPQAFFDELDAEFHFTLDACALPENAKCSSYFTPEMDGLSKKWGGCRVVQSSVWARDRKVGRAWRGGCAGWRNRGYAAACQDGHPIFPRSHLWQGGDPIYPRAAEIRRVRQFCAVPVDGGRI